MLVMVPAPELRAVESQPEPHRPDPRVLQANERTLLAWIRTGVGVMAFGFVIARFGAWTRLVGADVRADAAMPWIGAGLVALAGVIDVWAIVRYLRVQRAVLANEAVPAGGFSGVVLAGVLALIAIGLALVLVGR
jgi:putative membrane protein